MGGVTKKVTPNNKILKAVILTAMISVILTGGIAVAAVSLSAKEIGFESKNENWQVDNVEDAMNDLYNMSSSNDSSEMIVEMSMTQSIIDTSSWNHTGVCKLVYNDEIIDSFTLPTFNYDISSKTTVGTTKIIEGKRVRLDCNTTGSNSASAIMTITLNLYVEEELVRTISVQNSYTNAPSLSDSWNIAGY